MILNNFMRYVVMGKILFVDDEKNILESYRRTFYSKYNFMMADSGQGALEIINNNSNEPFQVIVTDYKMPKMNGVELLEKVRAVSPDTVQIMLTGQADMEAIIHLINKGRIFRFLTKPCPPDDMASNIDDAIRQYELVTAERELLGKTLGGSIKVLTDLLSLAKPQAFNKTQRIRNLARSIYTVVLLDNKWQIEIAATLSQIGCVTIPDDILKKVYKGLILSEGESVIFLSHPSIGADMIKNIPRLEKVSEIIRYQEKHYDGSGFPSDDLKEDNIPAGSRILKIALDFDKAVNGGVESEKALLDMGKKTGYYDPAFLEIAEKKFLQIDGPKKSFVNREIPIDDIEEGMYLAEDLVSASGVIIGNRNQKLTQALIVTIKNYSRNYLLRDTIKVICVVR
jgi:response regulator RpfG family c-di-GMP phosphodiesterase